MAITIQLPIMDAKDTVEIEVKVNGKRRTYKYRVELLDWEDCEEPPEIRIQCIRDKIDSVGKDWQLISIGAPSEKNVPIMFRHRDDDPPSEN